jgi:hypothetical protein
MDVFISWSGERSGAAAEALKDWLPKIVNALRPWLSAADIDKGARWSSEIALKLKECKAGIICLTPENIHSDWLLFEAGALSKMIENAFVCPLLIGLEPTDVEQPLAQFQATRAGKADLLNLVKSLNRALGETALTETHIDEAFQVWWPKLESKLQNLPQQASVTKPHRPDREILEEILELIREQNRGNLLNLNAGMVGRTVPLSSLLGGQAVAAQRKTRQKFIRTAVLSVDPGATEIKVREHPNGILCNFESGGREYNFLVPEDVETAGIGRNVQALLMEMLPMAEPDSPSSDRSR